MPVNKEHIFHPGIYFVTFTNYKWLRLFEITNSYDLVYKWFDFLKSKGHSIAGYVVMPNHLHALIGFHPTDKSINTIVGNGKRFIAYDLAGRKSVHRYAGGYWEVVAELFFRVVFRKVFPGTVWQRSGVRVKLAPSGNNN